MFSSLKFKRWTGVLVALLMTLSILAPWSSKNVKAAETGKVFDIIEITDFHGALQDSSGNPAAAVLAQNINDIRKTNSDRTILIGGGDLYQGSPISNILKGIPVQKVMNSMGMELTALGNHEFDWGLDTIINTTLKDAKYSTICANLYDKATGKRVFEPYKIIEKDGVKIGFIGAVTTSIETKVLAKYVAPYDAKDIAEEINAVVPEVKSKGADVIIAVIHEGDNLDGKTGPIFDITNKLVGVDAVFGGDSHSIVNTTANGMPVYVAYKESRGYIHTKMTVGLDGKVTFAGQYVDISTDKANGYKSKNPIQDAGVKAIVDAAKAEVGPTFDVVIGKAFEQLTRTQTAAPYGESYLGNWSTDVMKKKANADVAMQNNGGLRIDIPVGDITVGTVFTLMPFDNEICIINMTKAQIKTVLEQAFMDGGKGIQLSGLKVKYDAAKPSMSRVIDITRENGAAISETEVLKVATNDFMATGGDGFKGFVAAGGDKPEVNTHILVRDALLEDIKANGKITTTMNTRLENVAKQINVVATSDLHGNILNYDYAIGSEPSTPMGLAKISTYIKKLKSGNPNIMVIDNGDTIQGSPMVYYYNMIDTKKVYPMMAVMGVIGYDTWTLGNHEFNYGMTTLDRIAADAKANGIHVLSANTYKSDNTNYFEPYFIKEFSVNGKTQKVAVLGLTNQKVPSWDNPDNYKGLHFNDLVEEANKWIPIIKEKGADVIIVTAHTGEAQATSLPGEDQIGELATKVSGIDVIVAGHTHKAIAQKEYKNPEGKTVIVTQPNKWGQMVSEINIGIDASGNVGVITSKNVPMDKNVAEDEAIKTLVQSYQDTTLGYVSTVLGTSTGEYTGAEQLVKPTPIMELINKVQMEAAGTQLSIAAPLSLKAYIPKGNITIKDVMSVYVYENFMYGIKMTGKQIKDWMEYSVRYYKQGDTIKDPELNIADYNLDQLYGATYDIDTTQPIGQRIKNLKYNGKPIKDTDVFTVAINNYRYNGGGGFMKAAGISNTDPSIVVYDSAKVLGDDGQVRSMMFEYIKKNKTISPTVTNNWKIYTTPVKEEGQQAGKVIEYIVKPGDVLWRIAQKYGLTYKQIGEYNKLKNFNIIYVGQKLLIPAN